MSSTVASPSMTENMETKPFTIILFYKYTRVTSTKDTLAWQQSVCERFGLKGRIRVATEGINGTLAGSAEGIQAYIHDMNDTTQPHGGIFSGIEYKYSTDSQQPFPALGMFDVPELTASGAMAKSCKLLLDRGQPKLTKTHPNGPATAGEESKDNAETDGSAAETSTSAPAQPHEDTHLTPAEFHEALLNFNPETDLLLDTRNAYETAIGVFEHAIDPKLRSFAQLPEYVTQNLQAIKSKKKILMYCTGGIRCEKASLYMAHRTGAKVQQLKGGIHKYLDEFPDGGLFRGKNFVFDGRLAMGSQDPTIVGKCVHCAVACDHLAENVVCRVCKMFVILCPQCAKMYQEKSWQMYCAEHILLAAGKDYDPNAMVSSDVVASSSPVVSSSPPAASSPCAAVSSPGIVSPDAEHADGDDGATRPEDAWSPPASDPGCPEQLESFLSRFSTAEIEEQIGEIKKILHFFRTTQKRAGGRSRNRKHNLHLQQKRLEEYLVSRMKSAAEAKGEVWVPPQPEPVDEKARKQREAKQQHQTAVPASHPAQPLELLSFVPLLNV